MSLVHISIYKKKSNEFVASRGFCRTPALEIFCEQSSDRKLQEFDLALNVGVDLESENFDAFLGKLEYVIDSVESIPIEYREKNFTETYKHIYEQFINDLRESSEYLKEFHSKNNIDDFNIEIV